MNLLNKFITFILSIFCVVTGTFFLMHALPGDPFIGDKVMPKEVLDALYLHYGLDLPLLTQYKKYLISVLQLDLGPSIVYPDKQVLELIFDGLPISFRLAVQSLILAIPLGILIGTIAAIKKTRWQDKTIMIVSTLGVSVPNFVFATLIQYVFAVKLHLLPIARWGDFSHTILPSIALAMTPIAYISRLVRSNMIEVLRCDYIKLALSKGLSVFEASIKHGLKNAILPVITYLGPVCAQIIMGSFMIEKIFAIPGLGTWMIESITARDYPMIMALTLFFSILLISMMFIVDMLHAFLDPRIRKPQKIYD